MLLGDIYFNQLATIRFEKHQLRQTRRIGYKSNPFTIRRPARMKGVVLEKCQFVGFSTNGRLHVEVILLIRCSTGGTVDEPFAIDRNIRTGSI